MSLNRSLYTVRFGWHFPRDLIFESYRTNELRGAYFPRDLIFEN